MFIAFTDLFSDTRFSLFSTMSTPVSTPRYTPLSMVTYSPQPTPRRLDFSKRQPGTPKSKSGGHCVLSMLSHVLTTTIVCFAYYGIVSGIWWGMSTFGSLPRPEHSSSHAWEHGYGHTYYPTGSQENGPLPGQGVSMPMGGPLGAAHGYPTYGRHAFNGAPEHSYPTKPPPPSGASWGLGPGMCAQLTTMWALMECHLSMCLEHLLTSVRVHVVENLYALGWWGTYTTTSDLVGKVYVAMTTCRGTWAFFGHTCVIPVLRTLFWWPCIQTLKAACEMHTFWYNLIFSGLYEMMQGFALCMVYLMTRNELKRRATNE